MNKAPQVPAAFINAIAEEGTKAEAIKYLQETWNDYCRAQSIIRKCHEAIGEDGHSDDESLPDSIATHIRERDQRIKELEAPQPEVRRNELPSGWLAVPVHPKARWALAYLPFERSDHYYHDRFAKVRDEAGLPDLVPHSARHIVATDILLRGGTLADVSAALHHKHWSSSARYSHLVTEHTERVLFGIGETEAKKVHTARAAAKRRKVA